MTAFERAFEKTIIREGGFSNDLADSGGATRFGVTEAVARANGYTGKMEELPLEVAKSIHRSQYWDLLNLSKVSETSELVAGEVYDTAVHCSASIAGKFLQRSLNVLNREEKDYRDIRADGLIGPLTLFALTTFFKKRRKDGGEEVILKVLNSLQGARYVEIAEGRKNEKFTFGWFKNRVGL
jgi:lysozyme family protein